MRKFFTIQNLCTLLFLLLLAIGFGLGLRPLGSTALRAVRSLRDGEATSTREAESYFNSRLSETMSPLITLNGGVERLLGKRAVNQRYRLDNGKISYVIPELDVSGIAEKCPFDFYGVDAATDIA